MLRLWIVAHWNILVAWLLYPADEPTEEDQLFQAW